MATARKAIIIPVRNRWTVKIGDGPDLNVQGNILSLEYSIGDGNRKIPKVSRKWFRVADTYGVQIEPGQNDIVILARNPVSAASGAGSRGFGLYCRSWEWRSVPF